MVNEYYIFIFNVFHYFFFLLKAKALDEDDFDLIEHDDNDKIDQNSITPDTPTPEGDDVDDGKK